MKNKINILKINNSIHNLFISIRADSRQKSIIQILDIYIKYSNKIVNNENIDLNDFIKEVKIHHDFYFVDYLIKGIKKNKIKDKSVDINWIKYNFNIYIYVFNKMIELFNNLEYEKLSVLASSMHNYPNFIEGKYFWEKSKYWDDHVSYYYKKYNDNFMDEYKDEFNNYYKN